MPFFVISPRLRFDLNRKGIIMLLHIHIVLLLSHNKQRLTLKNNITDRCGMIHIIHV